MRERETETQKQRTNVCVCVCVCVSERERGRERERERERERACLGLPEGRTRRRRWTVCVVGEAITESSYTKVNSVMYDFRSVPRRVIFSPRETDPECINGVEDVRTENGSRPGHNLALNVLFVPN